MFGEPIGQMQRRRPITNFAAFGAAPRSTGQNFFQTPAAHEQGGGIPQVHHDWLRSWGVDPHSPDAMDTVGRHMFQAIVADTSGLPVPAWRSGIPSTAQGAGVAPSGVRDGMFLFGRDGAPRSTGIQTTEEVRRTPMADQLQAGGHPITGPSPASMYGQQLSQHGLMNNAQAQGFFGQQGYMPRTTVGGAWGGPQGPLPFEHQPATAAGINNFLQQHSGPGGRFFTGAYPGMVSYGGGQRQGFLGPEPQGEPALVSDPNLAQRGGHYVPGTGWVRPSAQELSMFGAMDMGPASYSQYQERMGSPAQPSPYALANRQNYFERRDSDLGTRRLNVQQKAIARADARARDLGNLSHHEAMMFGVPGYAEAHLQAGLGHAGIAAQERMFGGAMQQQNLDRQQRTELANLHNKHEEMHWAHEQALQEGKHAAAQHLQEGMNQTQKEIAKLEGKSRLKAARQAGQTQKDVATINKEPAMADVHARERESLLKMGEFYRQQAQEALKSGDMAGYQEHVARSNDFMNQAASAHFFGQQQRQQSQAAPMQSQAAPPAGSAQQMFGGGPRTWASLPMAMRQQLAGKSPQEMVNNIRSMMPHLTQAEADQMIQDAHGPNHVTMYNPNGYGMSDVIGSFLGGENTNRFFGKGPKSPRIPFTNIPMPVIPGPLGVAQTYLGF